MKTEDQAWRALRDHASAQLRRGFADRVITAAHGAPAQSWRQLQAHAAAQIRPGFADRVLRAAREVKNSVPSLFDQFALGAATVAVCLLAVFVVHQRAQRNEEEQALASWRQLAAETQEIEQAQ